MAFYIIHFSILTIGTRRPDYEGTNAMNYVSVNLDADEAIRRHVYKIQDDVSHAFYSASITRMAESNRRRADELEKVLAKERQAASKDRETIALLVSRIREPWPNGPPPAST